MIRSQLLYVMRKVCELGKFSRTHNLHCIFVCCFLPIDWQEMRALLKHFNEAIWLQSYQFFKLAEQIDLLYNCNDLKCRSLLIGKMHHTHDTHKNRSGVMRWGHRPKPKAWSNKAECNAYIGQNIHERELHCTIRLSSMSIDAHN